MTEQLQNLLDFVNFTHDIRAVKRDMWVKGIEQFENDSEHSFQLAITSLYIIEHDKLELDAFRAMGLALVHDVLEVYAGDTPVFGSEEALSLKPQKEKQAISQLKATWPRFHLLHELISEYELRQSPESKFVYALDKLLPMLNNYVDNGRSWRRHKLDLTVIMKVKVGKIDIDPKIKQYYEDVLKLLQHTPEIFS